MPLQNDMDLLGIPPVTPEVEHTSFREGQEIDFMLYNSLFKAMQTLPQEEVNISSREFLPQNVQDGGKISNFTEQKISLEAARENLRTNLVSIDTFGTAPIRTTLGLRALNSAATTGKTVQGILIGDDPHADTDTPDPDLGAGKMSESEAEQVEADTAAAAEGHGASGEGLEGHDASDDGGIGVASGGQIKGHQDGEQVLSEPIAPSEEQADTELDDLGIGPVGVVNDPEGTTITADDLDLELPDKSYVLNAEAVELTGKVSINKMIKEAIDLAIEDGVDLPVEIKTAEKVPIRISQGEAVLPHPLDMYIGTSKLEKMNNRGLKLREQREGEKAPVEMAAAPSPEEDLLAQVQQPVA